MPTVGGGGQALLYWRGAFIFRSECTSDLHVCEGRVKSNNCGGGGGQVALYWGLGGGYHT